MSIEPETSLDTSPGSIIDHLKTIFPTFNPKQNRKQATFADFDELTKNLPLLIKNLPAPKQNIAENLSKMQIYRNYQEHKIHQKIVNVKTIDFIGEASKYNPNIHKIISEESDPTQVLDKIVQDSDLRIENIRRQYQYSQEEETDLINNNLHTPTKQEYDSDSLSLFDPKESKKEFPSGGLDFDSLEEDNPQNNRSSKIVLFTTSRRLVFGFDKVENLMDPQLDEEMPEHNTKDYLKDPSLNFESNYQSFKLIS
jgi:hypothetical protein